jgi:hypothetical protein
MDESATPHPPAPEQPASPGPDLLHELNVLRTQLQTLDQRMASMERRQSQMPALPQTNLLSGSFLSRAFAVLGHYLVASLIIAIPIYIVIFVIILFVGIGLSGM